VQQPTAALVTALFPALERALRANKMTQFVPPYGKVAEATPIAFETVRIGLK
jgi:hypothetical protein